MIIEKGQFEARKYHGEETEDEKKQELESMRKGGKEETQFTEQGRVSEIESCESAQFTKLISKVKRERLNVTETKQNNCEKNELMKQEPVRPEEGFKPIEVEDT